MSTSGITETKTLILASVCLFVIANTGYARTWTNIEGQSIEAELLEIKDKTITIRSSRNGQKYDYQIAQLSKEDQQFIAIQRALKKEADQAAEREAKLEDRKAEWTDDYNKALAEAKAFDLPILLLFTGSDWNENCIKLEQMVFRNKTFAKYANENLVLMKVDFPRKKEISPELQDQNRALRGQFGVPGYPTVYIVDTAKNKRGPIVGYGGWSANEYITKINGIIGRASR